MLQAEPIGIGADARSFESPFGKFRDSALLRSRLVSQSNAVARLSCAGALGIVASLVFFAIWPSINIVPNRIPNEVLNGSSCVYKGCRVIFYPELMTLTTEFIDLRSRHFSLVSKPEVIFDRVDTLDQPGTDY